MYCDDLRDGFQLSNHSVFYEQIEPIARIDAQSPGDHRQRDLGRDSLPAETELMIQARTVDALKKQWCPIGHSG